MNFRHSVSFRSLLLATVLPVIASCAGNFHPEPKAPISTHRNEDHLLELEPMIVDNFALIDHRGVNHELYRQGDVRAVVLISFAVACPILRWNLPIVEELVSKYGKAGVRFFYIDASPQDELADLVREADEFSLSVPILQDAAQLVLPSLDVKRTAEAFVIDTKDWRVVYRGRISDRATYGGQSAGNSQDYLDDALTSFLADREIEISRTKAEGCLIMFGARVEAEQPDYARHVAPILIKRCVGCHSTNGVAPWAMSSWKRVRGWSPMMREAVMTRRMPPWHADPHYGQFSNERALTPDEANMLVRWIESGANRGDGPDPLPEASRDRSSSEWPLGKPDLVVHARDQKIPATGIVRYRYDRAKIDIAEDIWVSGVDLRPSNNQVLHHAVILVLYPKHLEHLQPVYQQGVGSYFALYIPGMQSRMFPNNTGKWIPAGSKVVFQFHYTTTGKPEIDRPELALYLMDEAPKIQFRTTSAIKWDIKIPPGDPNYYTEAAEQFDRDVILYDLIPHMHYRGRSMRYDAHFPDGTVETLISIPNYDFNWQTAYHLDPPKFLPAGTKILCSGRYDNSKFNPFNPDPSKEVIWGPQSTDEMFIGYMDYHYAQEDLKLPNAD